MCFNGTFQFPTLFVTGVLKSNSLKTFRHVFYESLANRFMTYFSPHISNINYIVMTGGGFVKTKGKKKFVALLNQLESLEVRFPVN